MSYFTLVAGQGYFKTKTSIDDGNRISAERFASDKIDSAFARWDRSAWIDPDVPSVIQTIAEKLAVGEFLERTGASPHARSVDEEQFEQFLKREACELIDEVVSAGGPLLSDGTRQAPEPDAVSTGQGIRSIRLEQA